MYLKLTRKLLEVSRLNRVRVRIALQFCLLFPFSVGKEGVNINVRTGNSFQWIE